jgi:hypothetical protein
MKKRVLHCWADGPRQDDDCGTSCMLEHGHAGPHEWTRDDAIILHFKSTSMDVEIKHKKGQ